ncbi:Maf family protein [Schaalia suimastitidis]|uniref:Maf family protein n=1 Tax=Schaalia suimastitidis TaxID=121163 RepID=UPI000410A5DD|nr:Maf family protein [Schaalia suimastitidis]
MRLVLASKSPARRQTLENAGITPIIRISNVDEDAALEALPDGRAFSGGSTTPADEVTVLAHAKCGSIVDLVCAANPDITADLPTDEELFIVGCDSMLEINGTMVGKPRQPDIARERIAAMRNTEAILWTGHHGARVSRADEHGRRTLIDEVSASAATTVRFGDISDAEIEAYVASGEPLKVAGAFTIDALGGPFVTGIDGDHHSVVGISLPLLRQMAIQLGIFWPDLWDHRRSNQ